MAAARVAERLPVQPGLLGIEPEPLVPEIKFSVFGQVQRLAEVRVSPDGRHGHLVVRIVQPSHAGHSRMPLVVVYSTHEGDIPMLQHLAAQLGPGTHVLAICRGIDFDVDRHELRAWKCDRITPVTATEASDWKSDQQLDQERA